MRKEDDSDKEYRVLVLEDDDVDFLAVERGLLRSFEAVQCKRARCIAELTQCITDVSYDIVISDLNLPDCSGLETVTTLLDNFGHLPIVVLSGTDDESIALKAVHKGAQDFIPKKYMNDITLINRTLRHAIERHDLKRSLERKREKEHFLAHYDQCTALPNRLLFLDRLQQAIAQAKRNCSKFAVLFVDLDLFKHINDSIGHSAGDEVLRQVGQRMVALVRDSDTVARFGGDEFVITLQISDARQSEPAINALAQKLVDAINQPILYEGHSCAVGASIGVAFYPRHGHSVDHLLKNADIAMYEAKILGRNRVKIFNEELYEKKSSYFTLEKNLRHAVQNLDSSFELHYQPRVDLHSGGVTSVEALIRWPDPVSGIYIPPHEFIPIAEDIGLIEKIDQWVLEKACQKAVEWESLHHLTRVRIGVNVSSRSFSQPDFVNSIVQPLLIKYDVKGCYFEMEITEGILLSDTSRVLDHLHGLKALGFSLAIDDFGSGFSSLSYLNKFPIDTLKIDGSFMCDQQSSQSDKTLLKAIVALGNALNLKVVAECIETRAQYQYLESLDCAEGQGFYLYRPSAHWMPP